jgi:transcriptional regulator with XRE-family HTH domain
MTKRLIEEWLPIAELGEESMRERRSMTALPPIHYLADRAGMKQPQLACLETGQVEPKLDTLQRLAQAMGCEVHVSFQPESQRPAAAEPMLR